MDIVVQPTENLSDLSRSNIGGRPDNNVDEIIGWHNYNIGTSHNITDPGKNDHLKQLGDCLMGNVKSHSATPFYVFLACKGGK